VDGELQGAGTETVSVVERDGCTQSWRTVSGSFEHGQVTAGTVTEGTVTIGGMYAGMAKKLPSLRNQAWKLRPLCMN
jgi:hypothetical protein